MSQNWKEVCSIDIILASGCPLKETRGPQKCTVAAKAKARGRSMESGDVCPGGPTPFAIITELCPGGLLLASAGCGFQKLPSDIVKVPLLIDQSLRRRPGARSRWSMANVTSKL